MTFAADFSRWFPSYGGSCSRASAGLDRYECMSSHVYHELYIHLNWHTKENRALLRGEFEHLTHKVMRDKCRGIRGAYLHGLGGTDDHVHLAVSIEPSVTISELVRQLKGSSAHEVNQATGHKLLEWQRGYGVVSFGKSHLGWVLDYIRNQRQHHARGTLESRLEWFDQPDELVEKPG